MGAIQSVQSFADSDSGQLLLQAGKAVANGADPAQVLAGLAGSYAQGQSDFINGQAGQVLMGYLSSVQATGDVPGAFAAMAPSGIALGLTAGLAAVGVFPPLSTLLAGAVAKPIANFIAGVINGPVDKTFGALGGDFAWRARKYQTKVVPQGFVTFMESNGYSLSGAVLADFPNFPHTEGPSWPGTSLALAQWLLTGRPWGSDGYILLPGWTQASGGIYQLGIPYTLPYDAGDGWIVPASGWWWYPLLSPNDVAAFPSNLGARARWTGGGGEVPLSASPLLQLYDSAGVDVPKTYARVRATNSASVGNIVYKQAAYNFAADALENAADKQDRGAKLDSSDRAMLDSVGANKNAGAGVAAAVAALALLGK